MKKTLISALVVMALTAQLTGCNGNTPVEQSSESSSVVSEVGEPHSSTVSTTSSTSETSNLQSSSTATSSTGTSSSEPHSSTASTTSSKPETSSSESEPAPADNTPKWTETAVSGERYVNTDYISSRVSAIQGSDTVKQYRLNDKVTVVAKTDTNYYKLSDGSFIHSDYLSESKVTVQQTNDSDTDFNISSGNGEVRYVNDYCMAREKAAGNSKVVKFYKVYDEVTVIAEAENGYLQLSDGTFVESVYLSETKPPVTQYTYQSGYELKHAPFTGEKEKPAEEVKQIGEEESSVDSRGYEVFGYWVETPGGKFWFCENSGAYYHSMEDRVNGKQPAGAYEVFNIDPSIGNGIHLS